MAIDLVRQPIISDVPANLLPDEALVVNGSEFRGLSEASGGGTNNSSSNIPVVVLRRLDNGAIAFLEKTDGKNWSDTSTAVTIPSDFASGPAWLTVVVNGIPSEAKYITIKKAADDSSCYLIKAANNKAVVFCL